MKKVLSILVILIWLVGCTIVPTKSASVPQETITVTVVSKSDAFYLVYNQSNGLIRLTSDEFFEVGQVLEIVFDGTIMESYPVQLGKISKITEVKMEENDIILWVNIINHAINNSPLSDGTDEVALNLMEIEDAEKTAIAFILSDQYSRKEILSIESLEELSKAKDLRMVEGYKNGVYIEVIPIADHVLSVKLWRGLKVTRTYEYTYQKNNGIYSFQHKLI